MSEDDKSHLAILLPTATVALFSRDDNTIEAFRSLEKDWRFARIRLDVVEGDVDSARTHYSGEATPDLLIVQTAEIDSGFTDKLEALGEICSENTSAIVIGPVNDVNLYRRLIGMGVSDYLVRPVVGSVLANDIAEALIEQVGAAGSRLIAFMGTKGGVGTTSLAQAAAWSLATEYDQKTFLLDAAGGWSTLSVGMDFEPGSSLHDAANAAAAGDTDNFSRITHKAEEKLFVLSSGSEAMLQNTVDGTAYEELLDYLVALYPVVLVDLSAAPAELKRIVLSRAHRTMLVTTPALSAIRATRSLIQEIEKMRGNSDNVVDVILNMKGVSAKHEVSKAQIKEALEIEPEAVINFDADLFVGTESTAKRLGQQKNGGAVLEALMQPVLKALGLRMADKPSNDTGKGFSSLLGKLKSKS